MFSANDLGESLLSLTPGSSSGYLVGLSGGADSCALLAAMIELRPTLGTRTLRAIHVNHGLQAAAAAFADRCEAICDRLKLPLVVLTPAVRATPGRSLEEVAREARYASLAANLRDGECLLTAHHQQDQAETFLLQALRGSGVKGLSAMPGRRRLGLGWHLRPLLAIKRSDLRSYAAAVEMPAVQDSMNEDLRFDRAYLRHALWPALESRWPAAAQVLARSAAHVAEARRLIEDGLQGDLRAAMDGNALSVAGVRRLQPARRVEVLRAFIESAGVRPPATQKLKEALRQMLCAGADRMPAIYWSEHALRRYRERIYLAPAWIAPVAARDWEFRKTAVCDLGAGHGRLIIRPAEGGLDPGLLPAVLHVRSRSDAPVRSVRHLLQERGIVPWMRDSVPFIHVDKRLLAVADLWSDARFQRSTAKTGIAFAWESAPAIF